MVNYICPNCNKEFNKKSNFLYHTENRKKACGKNLILYQKTPEISSRDILSSSNAPEISCTINHINETEQMNLQENKIFKCEKCDKIFMKKFNLTRHKNGRCKIVKSQESINVIELDQEQEYDQEYDQDQENDEKYEQYKEQYQISNILVKNKKLNNLVNIDELDIDDKTKTILTVLLNQNKKLIERMNKIQEENNEIKEENKEMKEKINNIDRNKSKIVNNNITNTNTNSNNINTNNTQNNTINNTIIVAHGKEELNKIELEAIMKCMSTIKHKEIIPNMTKHVYLNDDIPENKNFCVVDMARNKCKYYDGNKWMIGKTTDKIGKIFDNVHNMLTDPFEKENINKTIEFIKTNSKKFNEKWIKISNIYLKSLYDEDDKENMENKLKVLDEIKFIFFNHKDEILQIKA